MVWKYLIFPAICTIQLVHRFARHLVDVQGWRRSEQDCTKLVTCAAFVHIMWCMHNLDCMEWAEMKMCFAWRNNLGQNHPKEIFHAMFKVLRLQVQCCGTRHLHRERILLIKKQCLIGVYPFLCITLNCSQFETSEILQRNGLFCLAVEKKKDLFLRTGWWEASKLSSL